MSKILSISDIEGVLRDLPNEIKDEKIMDIQVLSDDCGIKIDLYCNPSKSIIINTTGKDEDDTIDVSVKCSEDSSKKELKAGDYVVLLRDYSDKATEGSTGVIIIVAKRKSDGEYSALVDFGDICTYINIKDLEEVS